MNVKQGKDVNGNTIVKVSFGKGIRGFSIQTNGNMPRTHRAITWEGVINEYEAINETHGFIKIHGTERQKELLGWY